MNWNSILKNKVSLPPDGVSDVVILALSTHILF